jgi:hypothetical protein
VGFTEDGGVVFGYVSISEKPASPDTFPIYLIREENKEQKYYKMPKM